MPKLKDLTADELKAVLDRCYDLTQDLYEATNKARQGYTAEIVKPVEAAIALTSLARAALDLAGFMQAKAGLVEMRIELDSKHKGGK